MRKKVIITIIVMALLSVTYIFAIDRYDTMPEKLVFLKEMLSIEEVSYTEVGVLLEGVVYDEKLDLRDLQNKQDEIAMQLAHTSDCSKLCKISHSDLSRKAIDIGEHVKQGEVEWSSDLWQYTFTLKNQEDIHENSYYNLKIIGGADMKQLDVLRNRGYEQFKEWEVKAKETIYFKGFTTGMLTEVERSQIKDQLLENLAAKETGYYEDDLTQTTCAYYGYTPHIKAYTVDAEGQKTNVQISFKYDDIGNHTDIIIAFPFYNEPF